ncbi:hypothetical protein P3L10_023002 [Capsicum annuum]
MFNFIPIPNYFYIPYMTKFAPKFRSDSMPYSTRKTSSSDSMPYSTRKTSSDILQYKSVPHSTQKSLAIMMMIPKLLSLLQSFTLLYLFTVTFASTEQTDALIKWKVTLQNQNNSLLASWTLSSSACRDWYGDICFNGRITRLNITNASITGTLYDFPFSSLPFHEYLDLSLSNNKISGTIPPQISSLEKLQTLSIFDNHLNGPIPGETGYLRSLTKLSMGSNFLNGSIPISLGNLTNLSVLYLYKNQLLGFIPKEIGDLRSLTEISLRNNSLGGSIPASVGNLTNLSTLYLYENLLSGSIPQEIGYLRSLTRLVLSTNFLNGSIPASLGIRTTCPSGHLEVLDMHHNYLSGTLPTTFSIGSVLRSLNLYENEIEGNIFVSLANCEELQVLDLGDNHLIDTFPMWLGTLPNLF